MMAEDLVWRSAVDLATLIRTKQVSPVEVTETILARVEALNPRLNAFCLVTPDLARAAAREAEIAVMKAEPLGLLHGVPVSIKDVIFTRGVRSTGGSRLFVDLVPEGDALAVGRIRATGGVIVGKTTTSEFGHKGITESPLFGVSRNPWNLALTPGGSSGGGAAAVASALGPLALGTDGGGSVRIPASFCGVVGMKPSFGRVPQGPGFPGWQNVGHTGPIARTVRDVALMLDAVTGGDDRDRRALPGNAESFLEACDRDIRGLHVAWTPDLGYATVDPRVLAVCENAAAEFESFGCHVEVVNPGWENPEEAFATLVAAQFYAAWSDRLPDAEEAMDPTLVRLIRKGGSITARDYIRAVDQADIYWQEVQAFLARFDLLLMPTAAVPPFPAGEPVPRTIADQAVGPLGWMPFTYPFNLTGQPAVSVPAGWTDEGLPVGLQIVGQLHADHTVLAAASVFEAAFPWADRRPPA
jgi:aspartyl-tRNA(Asn)/glutamyl-tRNA(Gln) amidotransferase subunit A